MAAKKWFPVRFIRRGTRVGFAEQGVEVKRVKDLRTPIVLNVTKRYWEIGTRMDPFSCALAKCAVASRSDDLADIVAAAIGVRIAYLAHANGDVERANIGPDVREALIAFDHGAKPVPGRYELRPPTPTQRLGADKRRKRATGPKKVRRPDKTHVVAPHRSDARTRV